MQLNNPIKMITLTHANTGDVVNVVASLIFAYYYSNTHQATIVVGLGGAMFPVKESPIDINEKLTNV